MMQSRLYDNVTIFSGKQLNEFIVRRIDVVNALLDVYDGRGKSKLDKLLTVIGGNYIIDYITLDNKVLYIHDEQYSKLNDDFERLHKISSKVYKALESVLR